MHGQTRNTSIKLQQQPHHQHKRTYQITYKRSIEEFIFDDDGLKGAKKELKRKEEKESIKDA